MRLTGSFHTKVTQPGSVASASSATVVGSTVAQATYPKGYAVPAPGPGAVDAPRPRAGSQARPYADAVTTSTALLTDHYELTMIEAALRGRGHEAVRLRALRAPPPRRAPIWRRRRHRPLLEALTHFRFDAVALEQLARTKVVDEPTLAWLADYRFTGDISGYAEGEAFFPGSPRHRRRVRLRRGRGAGDPGPVDPQPRQCRRRRGLPDDLGRRRPALHRDGLAAHP